MIFTETVASTSTAIPPMATDTTSYSFDLPVSTGGMIDIRARLIYRRAWRPLVDTKGWVNEGNPLNQIGQPPAPLEDLMAPHFGHLMEESTIAPIDLGPFTGGPSFLRGDSDGDGVFNGVVDGVFLLNFAFSGGAIPPCMEAVDVNGDGVINGVVDGVFLLTHAFSSGPPPPAPYPACGTDPDPAGSLGCGGSACP